MKRWLVPLVALGLWAVLLIYNLSTGIRTPRQSDNAFSGLLAPVADLLSPVRRAFMTVTAGLPSIGGQLVAGLTTGDTSRVSEALSAAMKTTSLTHLTAVSGANCQIVMAAAFGLLAWVGAPRWLRIAGAMAVLVAFVAFVTPQASVVRAATMSLAVLVGLVLGRLSSGIPALAISVIVLLTIEPRWASDYGFVLSVLATLGILLLTAPLVKRLQAIRLSRFGLRGRLPRPIAIAVAVPVAASLMCQPVIVLLQPVLPTYGVLANIAAEPVAAIATVTGLIAAIAASIWMPLGQVMAWTTWLPAEWIGRVATFFSSLPLAQLPWFDAGLGVVTAALLSAAVVMLVVSGRRSKWMRGLSMSIVFGAVCVSGAVAVNNAVAQAVGAPADWLIAACDVGQGDALILRMPSVNEGFTYALIDTGRSPDLIAKCTARLGITRFDLLVLTHYDLDHIGGSDAVTQMTDAALIGTPANPGDQMVERDLRGAIGEVTRARAGMAIHIGAISGEVLWPDGVTVNMQTGNAGSVGMIWHLGSVSLATLADMGKDAQETLLAHTLDMPGVDVLKVAHHGSADTSDALTRRLHPRVAIISVGKNNGYGHPTSTALTMLHSVGAQVERTDQHGMVFISKRDNKLVITTDR